MTSPSSPESLTTAEPSAAPSGVPASVPAPAASGSPCCGTQEAARAAGACCDPAAKSTAVTAGATCCG